MPAPLVYSIYDLLIYAPKASVSKQARRDLAAGVYENDEAQLLPVVLDTSLPLVELGAGIGVVSCFANRLLKDPAAHVAVEMHPDALAVLEVNRAMNRARFEILSYTLVYGEAVDQPGAAGPAAGAVWSPSARLSPGGPSASGRLLDIVEARGFTEFNLVMDIEGAELRLLEEEQELIASRAASVSLELHPHVLGVDGAARVVRLLMDAGLRLTAIGEGSVIGLCRA